MEQIIEHATTWYTLPVTVLFCLVILYWVLAIFGAISSDALDFDIDSGGPDLDMDVDADAGVDMDHDVDFHHESGGLGLAVLRFLNFGQVPGMVVISVFVALLWFGSMIGNFALNAAGAALLAVIVFGVVFILALLLTKFLTLPLVPLFRSLNKEGDTHESIVGRQCRIRSGTVTEDSGQAEVERAGASFLINVRVAPGRDALSKGDLALVVDHAPVDETYLIKQIEKD